MTVAKAVYVLFALGLLAAGNGAQAAPKSDLWSKWTAQQTLNTATIDHTAWDGFLKRHVRAGNDGIARVAYRAVDAADRQRLAGYVAALEAIRITGYARREQLPYWINLYNALTVKTVLERYPVASIRDIDISPGLFASGPWGRKLVTVENEKVSLDDIEHRILRPIWRDPRVHYALNCAALGCPNLQRDAFTAANSETLLHAGASAYVNHPRGARIENGRLVVSSIYVWFKADFGDTDAGVIAHLLKYATPQTAATLAGRTALDGDRYDWRLNDAN